MTDTSSKFFRPPAGAEHRVTYMHGFIDGCNAGREEALALIAATKSEMVAAVIDPELERRRQIAEVEIVEAEARLKRALADRSEYYAQRRKPKADV
jgi:hypothetical protein